MRKNFGVQNVMYPEPVLMVATYDEEGNPNVMTAAWGGFSEEGELTICISSTHKTAKNLKATGAFTVSMATAEMIAACDYVGLKSANTEKEKLAKAGFSVEKSEFVNAPLIVELPMAIECKVKSYDDELCLLVGEIVNISADESILGDDGLIDLDKFHPVIYDGMRKAYHGFGVKIADAFKVGLTIK